MAYLPATKFENHAVGTDLVDNAINMETDELGFDTREIIVPGAHDALIYLNALSIPQKKGGEKSRGGF